jgi:pyruvate/2-oxoglutarate dehydrogenase complex dihydrolipoamide acyltransferase (E2) component
VASTGKRSETSIPISRMRLTIAKRLKNAQNTAACLTTFNEIDMHNIMALRSKYKDEFAKVHGVKMGFMSAFVKVAFHPRLSHPNCHHHNRHQLSQPPPLGLYARAHQEPYRQRRVRR